ncbi:exodeoxyribonuclease III [Stutzerimonas stutzeri]|uniref:exodeoxyribonuclease III n=1 Tax=Stutzerimonas stutzeri TaxID=316 RepID=UPI0002E861D0|nr:exodeoxyribonuclease III [Stutzerimonas stutzeri]QOZ94971.1 exodeoxyribonuclease III [Stutzerimonas stutzeri]
MDSLKIATYNINGIRARRANLLEWLAREQPDVVCLQELKAQDADFPIDDIRAAGYGAIWQGQKSWNGVAILARDYKLAWFERFIEHAAGLLASGHPVVLAGDYNVVPTDEDIYNPRSWRKDALLQPESRACYERLLAQGWTDALRAQFPDEPVYTFWDYFRQHWQKNSGLRIDHLLLSPDLAPRLQDAGVDRWVRDQAHASDHAPTWVRLAVDEG